MGHLTPYVCLILAFLGLGVTAARSQRNAVKLSQRGWEDLLSRFQKVDIDALTTVALDYLNPKQNQTAIQPRVLWKLVGHYEGLRRMRSNADLMLALAAHARHWNFDEATIVGERMRRDALRLRSALWKIEAGFLPFTILRQFHIRTPFQIQEAAAAYYLMRERLLALYVASHSGRYPVLAAVL
jgi:hypothetical protein